MNPTPFTKLLHSRLPYLSKYDDGNKPKHQISAGTFHKHEEVCSLESYLESSCSSASFTSISSTLAATPAWWKTKLCTKTYLSHPTWCNCTRPYPTHLRWCSAPKPTQPSSHSGADWRFGVRLTLVLEHPAACWTGTSWRQTGEFWVLDTRWLFWIVSVRIKG